MLLYTDLDKSLERAKERAAAGAEDSAYLTELLLMSAGIHAETGQTVYRPFYVAAKYLEQSRRDQSFKSGDGSEFTGQKVPIQSLLDMQASLDAGLTIPRAFQINPPVPDSKQLKTAYDNALIFLRRYQPRGLL